MTSPNMWKLPPLTLYAFLSTYAGSARHILLHQLHVVHRDLKPENVVFFEKLGMVKLTDFGFSNKYNPGQKLETSCGSLAYSAPEILLGDSYDAPAVDIWSLGVILYMLVCGHPPFQVILNLDNKEFFQNKSCLFL